VIIPLVESLMSCSRRQDRNVARLELEDATSGSAEADHRVAVGDSQHLMNLRVVVDVIEDPVAP
jgi:hypothetical protein